MGRLLYEASGLAFGFKSDVKPPCGCCGKQRLPRRPRQDHHAASFRPDAIGAGFRRGVLDRWDHGPKPQFRTKV